jgi:pimeloyl-ACP methyl ester carboxylesterase
LTVQPFRARSGSVLHVDDCGHLPFLEAPAEFARAAASFLATLC